MKTFRGLSAAEFYGLRDQRTQLAIGEDVLANANLHLSIDEREASQPQGQAAFLTLVNLCSRWCRRIIIEAPLVPITGSLGPIYRGLLRDESMRIAEAADPFIDLSTSSTHLPNRIHVGMDGPSGAFCICGRDWMAYGGAAVASAPESVDPLNLLGAVLSACAGTSHAMRVAIGDEDLYSTFVLSLWNLKADSAAGQGPSLKPFSLGEVLGVGLGAIGSSMLYMLGLSPVEATPTLVDEDFVDYPNLNRSPVFFAEDVGLRKVIVAGKLHSSAKPIPMTIQSAVERGLRIDLFDFVVPAANVPEARTTIMSNTPPLMISGSTGTRWDAYQQRHIPMVDDCLICRFPLNGAPPAMGCSTGNIAPTSQSAEASPQTGALPFLSLSGAVLATAEILKLPLEIESGALSNRTILSFRSPSPMLVNSSRQPKNACSYCITPELFETLGGGRRFASLSRQQSG